MKILKLNNTHKIELAKVIFELKSQLLPKNFNSCFVSVSAIHNYNTGINKILD